MFPTIPAIPAAASALACLISLAQAQGPVPGQTEDIGDITVTHRFVDVPGATYHLVEAGAGPQTLLFLHGLPESWWTWRHQLNAFAPEHRVVALDLKGYGLSSKDERDPQAYHPEIVAREVLAVADALNIDTFTLITHDRGTVIGDYLGGLWPERVDSYARLQQAATVYEREAVPFHTAFGYYPVAVVAFSQPDFVHSSYENTAIVPIDDADLARSEAEWQRPGLPQSVARYFQARSPEDNFYAEGADRPGLFAAMDFPVSLIQADSDPSQPIEWFEDSAEAFLDGRLIIIEGSGHFSPTEQPEAVNQAIEDTLALISP